MCDLVNGYIGTVLSRLLRGSGHQAIDVVRSGHTSCVNQNMARR